MNRRPTTTSSTAHASRTVSAHGGKARPVGNAGSGGDAPSWFAPTRFPQLAGILVSGVLVSSTLVTADSVSVYEGKSLPQVLVVLIALLCAVLGSMRLSSNSVDDSQSITSALMRPGPILLATLVLWLWISSFVGAQMGLARLTWNGFWHLLGLVGFALVMRSLCASATTSRVVLQLVLFCALFQSVYALHQYAISMPAARASYLQDPEGELLKADIDAPPGSALRAQYEARLLSSFEPSATFALTNSLAVLLSGAIIAWAILIVRSTLLIALSSDSAAKRGRQVALIVAALAWLLVVCVWLLTKSRTGVLAVIVMACLSSLALWIMRRKSFSKQTDRVESSRLSTRWIIGGALVLVSSFAALVAMLSRDSLILSEAPKSIAYRIEYWRATSRMVLDYPLTGVGLGNFQSFYPKYKLPTASETIADPHNWCFDVAACLSIPSLIIVLVGLCVLTIRAWQQIVFLEQRAQHVPEESRYHNDAGNTRPLESASSRNVWIGAVVGWLITALLQIVSHESFDFEPSLIAVLVSASVVALWSRTVVTSMSTDRLAALLGLVTMLLALLASGSWQASGIALPMIALLAVAWPVQHVPSWNEMSEPSTDTTSPDASLNISSSKPQSMFVVGMIALLASFLFQTWQPVNASWSAKQKAANELKSGNLPAALEHTLQSIAADPANTDSRRLLVQLYSMAADGLSSGDGPRLQALRQQVDAALDELLRVGRASYLNWSFAAQTHITLAASAARIGETSEVKACLTKAAEVNQQAIMLYPSSVALHAQQATLWALLNEQKLLQQALDTTFELSAATPHLDRKLATQQVWLPTALVPQLSASAIVRLSASSNWVQAEPLCEALRSN